MDEREAIADLRKGDIRALEALVRAHQVRAVRTAYLITRDAALAQDVVQSAFLRAYERIGQLDSTRPFGPWFMTSVMHDAIKAVSKRNRDTSFDRLPAVELAVIDNQSQPDAVWEQTETTQEVWTALGELTPEQRAVVVARYYLGLSQAEMTLALRCTPSTVKWRLHVARA